MTYHTQSAITLRPKHVGKAVDILFNQGIVQTPNFTI